MAGAVGTFGYEGLEPPISLHHFLFPGLELLPAEMFRELCLPQAHGVLSPHSCTAPSCARALIPQPGDFPQRCLWEFPPHFEGFNRLSVFVLFPPPLIISDLF